MPSRSIQIPKKLQSWDDLLYELRELIEYAKKHGEAEDELYETVFEDVEVENEDDYNEYVHREIPELLRSIFRFLRFKGIRIYHKKDDVPGSEYLIEAMRGQSSYVFELDIDYDIGGRWELMWARVVKGAKISEGYLPYYHEV
jgi:hypothetical protein